MLPPRKTLDGEIVIADQQGVPDFGALQDRLARSTRHLARRPLPCPAILVVFDLLALDGGDLIDLPLGERRRHLELLLREVHPYLQLVEQTASIDLARDWLASAPNLEGVVTKRVDGRYRPAYRGWVKVKRERTADCVVVGLVCENAAPVWCSPCAILKAGCGPVESLAPSRGLSLNYSKDSVAE